MPSWATFSTSSGQLSGTPSGTSVGAYSNIVIAVSDGYRTATLPAFTVQVLAGTNSPPPPPTISGTPPTTDVAGTPYAFQPSASGPSGMTLSFSVQNKPSWATFSIASGLISGTPTSTQTGTYANIIVSVSDGQASSALPAFGITVTAADSHHRFGNRQPDPADAEYGRQHDHRSRGRDHLLRILAVQPQPVHEGDQSPAGELHDQ